MVKVRLTRWYQADLYGNTYNLQAEIWEDLDHSQPRGPVCFDEYIFVSNIVSSTISTQLYKVVSH